MLVLVTSNLCYFLVIFLLFSCYLFLDLSLFCYLILATESFNEFTVLVSLR